MNDKSYTRKNFPVLGMSCAACAISVESMLKNTQGIKDAGVNYANQIAWAEVEIGFDVIELKKGVNVIKINYKTLFSEGFNQALVTLASQTGFSSFDATYNVAKLAKQVGEELKTARELYELAFQIKTDEYK